MNKEYTVLSKEDYEEPCCPLKMNPEIQKIPVSRVIGKLDEYLDKNDTAGAERHLAYWLAEAEAGNDWRGELTVLNEQIGLYRKTGKETEGLRAIEGALTLTKELGLENTVSCGTTLINAATAYRSFDQAGKALPLYRRAREIYERELEPEDGRLGGLYNNMAVTLTALRFYDEAEELFEKALEHCAMQPNGEAEMAITWLNIADLRTACLDPVTAEKPVWECLDHAEACLESPSIPHDGYYAFVCEKCAPVFGTYGRFLTEKKLRETARNIYERT